MKLGFTARHLPKHIKLPAGGKQPLGEAASQGRPRNQNFQAPVRVT